MPQNTCSEILEHGFQKGSGRVGRSQKLEDKLKVQLAVNAHIRHRLTQYESLLAVNKRPDAKLAAREIVYGQVHAIADSWRATSSRARNSESKTPVPRKSATTLAANRQRRTQANKPQITPVDEAQVVEEALEGLQLSENERESRAEAAQRRAQKKAQKRARKGKKGEKRVLRLQTGLEGNSSRGIDNIDMEPEAKGYNRQVTTSGRDLNIDLPHESPYPLRSSYRVIGAFNKQNHWKGSLENKYPSEDRLRVEDSEWMDIDDISLRTAGVHLA